jgi:hypothetical protein
MAFADFFIEIMSETIDERSSTCTQRKSDL